MSDDMNVERTQFEAEATPEEAAAMAARVDAAVEKARRDPRFADLFEPQTREQLAARIEQARAQVAAGRTVPHEKVAEWVKTWGTPQAGPPPREWFE